jgi:hypothetical protein
MLTSARSVFLHCSRATSVTSRTAVYGPVRTVVWQGSAGDCRPYADQTGQAPVIRKCRIAEGWVVLPLLIEKKCVRPHQPYGLRDPVTPTLLSMRVRDLTMRRVAVSHSFKRDISRLRRFR